MVLHIVVADRHMVRLLRCEPEGGGWQELLDSYSGKAKLATLAVLCTSSIAGPRLRSARAIKAEVHSP